MRYGASKSPPLLEFPANTSFILAFNQLDRWQDYFNRENFSLCFPSFVAPTLEHEEAGVVLEEECNIPKVLVHIIQSYLPYRDAADFLQEQFMACVPGVLRDRVDVLFMSALEESSIRMLLSLAAARAVSK